MTPEEAKKLKAGDLVLVEAVVVIPTLNHMPLTNKDDVSLKTKCNESPGFDYVRACPEAIREKLPPPRRLFRKGDIVSRNGHLYYVAEDEKDNFKVALDCSDGGIMYTEEEFLTLEISVETIEAMKKKGE